LSGVKRRLWFEQLDQFALATTEAHISTRALGASKMVVPYGITDAALGSLPDKHVLITAEHRLSGYLISQGRVAINFNHFRIF
jgi:hypothetical protein